ncbi:hypothetical protein [Desulfomicrobium salsuginis]
MKSETAVNRRFFFRRSVAHVLDTLCFGSAEESMPSKANYTKDQMSALFGDLSSECLKGEARRLGIDPSNKEEIAEKLMQEMLSLRK